MKVKRNIIEIDEELCNGCGQCIITCAEGALELIEGKARLVAEKYCDGLGACLGECPTGALKVIQRESDDFDEEAVVERLEELKQAEAPAQQTMACGCPGAHLQTFARPEAAQCAGRAVADGSVASALTHWPVQIHLVPPTAPFLKNASLLVAADCTAFTYAFFHRDFLEGKVLMVGCPKFDDAQAYVDKFAQIFTAASVQDVTVVVMEVPCCAGLPLIVKKGMELAGKNVPLQKVVVSVRGEILKSEKMVA
jgi:NAD-dependent dihydropyrimidine dehydrogenase PreA subunit